MSGLIPREAWPVIGVAVQVVGAIILAFMAHRVKLLEQNTNSIKDALVKEVGESNMAKGLKQGRAEVIAERPQAGDPPKP